MVFLTKTAKLKVENSARTTFRLSPVCFCAPDLVWTLDKDYNKTMHAYPGWAKVCPVLLKFVHVHRIKSKTRTVSNTFLHY